MEQVRGRTEVGPSIQEESGEMASGGVESIVGGESSGSVEHTAQAVTVTGSIRSEQPAQEGSMSEGESIRLNSEVSEETHQETNVGGGTSAAPRRSEEDNSDGWSVEDGGSDKGNDDNAIEKVGPSEESSDQSPAVKPGYEGR